MGSHEPRLAPPDDAPPRPGVVHMLFRRWVKLRGYHVAFVALNFADLILTWTIMAFLGTEVNPVAAWLMKMGDAWLVAYKFGLTAFVIVLVEIIHEAKPRTARYVAIAGIAVMGFVVLRSLFLLAGQTTVDEVMRLFSTR